ncbi:MAG: hypothetical protein DMF87_06365 [Acidobacteria bacterium]|nr:MAG: hypothetical protein DMF87_06365 [Acidobacteriota bacterium]
MISISKGWKDKRRNDVQLHRDVRRNDWIDLVLALYVGRGDCVVSDDGLHKTIFTDFGVPLVRAADL